MEQLIPREELASLEAAPAVIPRWVKYGSIITGAALLLARLGGVAYADGGGHGAHGGHGDGDHAKSGHGGDHGGHMATQAPAAPPAKAGSRHGGSAKAVQTQNATDVKSAKSVNSAVVAGAVATAKSANTSAQAAGAVVSAKSANTSAQAAAGVPSPKSANTTTPTPTAGANVAAAATSGTVQGDTAQSVKTAEVTGEK
jgi:hypothetical protein